MTSTHAIAASPGGALGRLASLFTQAQTFRTSAVAGGTAEIPGPVTPDYVRVFKSVDVASVAATPGLGISTTVNINPGGMQVAIGSIGAPVVSISARAITPIAFGEVLTVTNGSAASVEVSALYVDELVDNIGLFRVALTDTFLDVIPVAPNGMWRRFLQYAHPSDQGPLLSNLPIPRLRAFNVDTVLHTLEFAIGNDVLCRHGADGPMEAFVTHPPVHQWPVTTIPLRARLFEPIATRAVYLVGAYETLPL